MKCYYEVYVKKVRYTYFNETGTEISYEEYMKYFKRQLIEVYFNMHMSEVILKKFSKLKDAKAFHSTLKDIGEDYYREWNCWRKVELF